MSMPHTHLQMLKQAMISAAVYSNPSIYQVQSVGSQHHHAANKNNEQVFEPTSPVAVSLLDVCGYNQVAIIEKIP
jgi:hypothetical protein